MLIYSDDSSNDSRYWYIKSSPFHNANELSEAIAYFTTYINNTQGVISTAEWEIDYRIDYDDYRLFVVYERRI